MKKKDKKQSVACAVSSVIEAYRDVGENTDPNGMYTGNTRDTNAYPAAPERPVQDADDL